MSVQAVNATLHPVSGGGTDWSKYEPIGARGTTGAVAADAWQTILNVTGKGFLKTATAAANNTAVARVKVTIDGVVKFWSNAEYAAIVTGLIGIEQRQSATLSSPTSLPVDLGAICYNKVWKIADPALPYPTTVETAGANLLTSPIFFNTSLLVQVAISIGSGTQPITYDVAGGLE